MKIKMFGCFIAQSIFYPVKTIAQTDGTERCAFTPEIRDLIERDKSEVSHMRDVAVVKRFAKLPNLGLC